MVVVFFDVGVCHLCVIVLVCGCAGVGILCCCVAFAGAVLVPQILYLRELEWATLLETGGETLEAVGTVCLGRHSRGSFVGTGELRGARACCGRRLRGGSVHLKARVMRGRRRFGGRLDVQGNEGRAGWRVKATMLG